WCPRATTTWRPRRTASRCSRTRTERFRAACGCPNRPRLPRCGRCGAPCPGPRWEAMLMSEGGVRPARPSNRDPAVLANKFAGRPARLAIRVDKATLHGIRKAATNDEKTVKRFVLDMLREKGVEIAAIDLIDDGDE